MGIFVDKKMTEQIAFTIEKEKKYVHAVAFKIDDDGLFKLDQCFDALKVRGKRRSDRMRNFIAKTCDLIEDHAELSRVSRQASQTVTKYRKLQERHAKLKQETGKLARENIRLTKTISKLQRKLNLLQPRPNPKDTSAMTNIKPTRNSTQESEPKIDPSSFYTGHNGYPSYGKAKKPTTPTLPKRWDRPQKPVPSDRIIPEEPEPSDNVVTQETEAEEKILWCPYKDDWLHIVKCGTCQVMRFKIYTDCQARRLKNPKDPIFTPTKPRPLRTPS